MWHLAAAGSVALAAVTIAPVAIPLGLLVGGLAWSLADLSRCRPAPAGSPPAPRPPSTGGSGGTRSARARARIAAPGSVPLTARNGGHRGGRGHPHGRAPGRGRWRRSPIQRLRSHQVVIGTTGTGKTTLLLRLWAGFMARGAAAARGRGRAAGRCWWCWTARAAPIRGGSPTGPAGCCARPGARSTAIWPDEASLSLWALPPRQLTTTLVDMIEHGTGGAAYYADVMEAVVALAVDAPGGPPASAADFLARLDAGWLAAAYAGSPDGQHAACCGRPRRQVSDIALRFRTLFRRLGDGPGRARRLRRRGRLVLHPGGHRRRSRSPRRRPGRWWTCWPATPRSGPGSQPGDPAGGGRVQRRVPAAADLAAVRAGALAGPGRAGVGPVLAGAGAPTTTTGTGSPPPPTAGSGCCAPRIPSRSPALAGSRPAAGHHPAGARGRAWGREGSSRVRGTPVADPAIIRSLDVGQAAYIYRGGVTFVQVKRLVAAPAALTREPVAPREPVGQVGGPPARGQGTTHGPAARRRQPARRSVRQRNRLNRRCRDTLLCLAAARGVTLRSAR